MLASEGVGLGSLVALPNYEECPPPFEPECVARNAAKNTAYNLALEAAQANNNYTQCMANAANASGPTQYAEVVARCNNQFIIQTPDLGVTTPIGQVQNPVQGVRFTFTTSRGAVLYPGDTWSINITGGKPGLPVSTSGTMKGQPYSGSVQGALDGSGNWQTGGAVTKDDIGVWNEQWYVQGQLVGQANFEVRAPIVQVVTQPAKPPVAPPSGPNTNTSNNVTTGSAGQIDSNPFTDLKNTMAEYVPALDRISGMEMALIAAAVVGVGYFMTRGGR